MFSDHGPLERLQLGLHLLPLIIDPQVNLLKCGLRLDSGVLQPRVQLLLDLLQLELKVGAQVLTADV